ncbi:LuxR C-terminal-related transcriptional regulator [Actinoplanes sp. TRM 88003]|uniref:LuxR C-terminal-related transcriptional regulator n=1 Tax=Paractinoplanes aksuensis TaxID=2939490 RepID=A0ABT1E773_9ACTN|nr:LuxR C-terminal-related transcriptional regulator [Actinoplanes aksuensis]MCO8277661.1 LuxR C-terminal-related transcriptional regulator [Actinoplanes aksuensis]
MNRAVGGWSRKGKDPQRSALLLHGPAGVGKSALRRQVLTEGGDRGFRHLPLPELQIATLAAQGLNNRDIAQRLFVSPRTVSSYLYRIYPWLGVTGRAQLGEVLAASPAQSATTPGPEIVV